MRGNRLTIDPCVAKSWKRFEITYRDGEGTVHVVVENPRGVERGVTRVEVEGREVPDRIIPLTGEKRSREVRVEMG